MPSRAFGRSNNSRSDIFRPVTCVACVQLSVTRCPPLWPESNGRGWCGTFGLCLEADFLWSHSFRRTCLACFPRSITASWKQFWLCFQVELDGSGMARQFTAWRSRELFLHFTQSRAHFDEYAFWGTHRHVKRITYVYYYV